MQRPSVAQNNILKKKKAVHAAAKKANETFVKSKTTSIGERFLKLRKSERSRFEKEEKTKEA